MFSSFASCFDLTIVKAYDVCWKGVEIILYYFDHEPPSEARQVFRTVGNNNTLKDTALKISD